MAAIVLSGVLGWIAYRRKTRPLTLLAVLVAAVVFSGVFPAGFLVFPILLGVWRGSPRQGYGFVLLASMVLSAVVLWWRIPKPPDVPAGPHHRAVATVRQVEMVDHIWSTLESAGQDIPQPFQMADLEFVPEAATGSIHVLDRIDANSVPGLKQGGTVAVVYSAADARSARIDGGTRTYPEKALAFMLKLTYGIAAIVVFVVFPIILLIEKIRAWVAGVQSSVPIDRLADQTSRMRPDDPRRKALEGFMRRRQRSTPLGNHERE